MKHHRPYTGSVDHYAGLLRSGADGLHLEACGLARRMWSEDQAAELVKSWLPHMRESIARAQRAVAEIEATIITVEEEQDAAKEAISRDAA
jgi:hypothetical protein